MTTRLELVEYDKAHVRLSPDTARSLATARPDAIGVALRDEPGSYTVTTGKWVGTLVVGDVQVLIRPKIRPENLFLLLEVGLPSDAWRPETFLYETTGDLLPSVIAFFARALETTLARGVLRSYIAVQGKLVTLRGRIDIAAQFRQSGVRLPVACRYDEYSADILENRHVEAAARLALRVPGMMAEDRRRLQTLVVALEEVSDSPIRADDLDRLPVTRLNRHYEPALRLARLLLERLSLVDQSGEHAASSFLLDMNQLFEDFVTNRLRRALRGRLDVLAQVSNYLDAGRTVQMRPDLVFRRRGTELYVADIKYKTTAHARALPSDYYQLLAYTTALDLPEGVLIYCREDDGAQAREVMVRHSGKTLHTFAIDLTGAPAEVMAAIGSLADWVEDRACASTLRV